MERRKKIILKSDIALVKEIIDKQYQDAKKFATEITNKEYFAGYLQATTQCKELIDKLAEIANKE